MLVPYRGGPLIELYDDWSIPFASRVRSSTVVSTCEFLFSEVLVVVTVSLWAAQPANHNNNAALKPSPIDFTAWFYL
jgi:hypothetical protein